MLQEIEELCTGMIGQMIYMFSKLNISQQKCQISIKKSLLFLQSNGDYFSFLITVFSPTYFQTC